MAFPALKERGSALCSSQHHPFRSSIAPLWTPRALLAAVSAGAALGTSPRMDPPLPFSPPSLRCQQPASAYRTLSWGPSRWHCRLM